ncbi:hypothetical protein ABPG77_000239 [Micractinium sp. CCAP 211/92]
MSDSDLRSSTAPGLDVTHRVLNQRSSPIRLYWLDYEGRAVPYGIVEPEGDVSQSTYSTHAWRICDEQSGLSLAEYVGPSATLSLLADGSLRIQVTPEPQPAAEGAARAPAEAGDEQEAAGAGAEGTEKDDEQH